MLHDFEIERSVCNTVWGLEQAGSGADEAVGCSNEHCSQKAASCQWRAWPTQKVFLLEVCLVCILGSFVLTPNAVLKFILCIIRHVAS